MTFYESIKDEIVADQIKHLADLCDQTKGIVETLVKDIEDLKERNQDGLAN